MFNDHLSNEQAKQYIKERVQEVETYSRLKRLGYGESGNTRWVWVLIILVGVVALLLIF